VEWIEEIDGECLIDAKKGDEKGEFTFTGGRGNTTIAFVIEG